MPIDARKVVLSPDSSPTPTGVAIGGLRLGFRAIAAVSPGTAARLAAQLWFRPPRPKVHPAAREFMKSGSRSTMLVHDRPVAVWRWGRGPAVILSHGWGGYGGQMQQFVEPLVKSGFQAVIFDAPAHGESGPSQLGSRKTTLFDFAWVLDAFGREHGELAGIIAHSGGSTAAAWALLSAQWKLRSMVFIAPMASPTLYKQVFHEALGLDDRVLQRFDRYTEKRFGFRWADLEVPGMASRATTTPPLLVVHDRDDAETSWDEGASIANAWPQSLLHTTEGLGHRRVLRDPSVVSVVTDFVAAHAK